MKVLGIDPGYDRLGIAVVEKQNGKETVLYSACLTTDKKVGLPERLFGLGQALSETYERFLPDVTAIETLFLSKNHKTAMAVAASRGMVIYLAKKYGCEVVEFDPQVIKVATTGYGKSDKQAVRDMLRRYVSNLPPDAIDDEYDAIAIGVTALVHHR